jgi:hypothetical protein
VKKTIKPVAFEIFFFPCPRLTVLSGLVFDAAKKMEKKRMILRRSGSQKNSAASHIITTMALRRCKTGVKSALVQIPCLL